MKTTIEIPDKTFRQAKTLAAVKGISVKQLVTEAIEDKVRLAKKSELGGTSWMKLFGAFAKSEQMRNDTRRIQKLIV